jgi:hypothetical protein
VARACLHVVALAASALAPGWLAAVAGCLARLRSWAGVACVYNTVDASAQKDTLAVGGGVRFRALTGGRQAIPGVWVCVAVCRVVL